MGYKVSIQKLKAFLYTNNEISERETRKNIPFTIVTRKIKYLEINLTMEVPQLVWLSGLSTGLRTKGSPVRFPVRAHAWVSGQVPSRGPARGNHALMFLSLSFSLPFHL